MELRVEPTTQDIENYCIEKSNIPSNDCKSLEDFTRANVHGAQMLIGQLEASVLGFLLRSIKAKRVLELGTFTGYSALTMAENLPNDGEVITMDINPETNKIAKEFWAKSKHGNKIKNFIGQAIEMIPTLEGEFDLVFIDADKRNYIHYLNLVLPKLSKQGMIVIDNVLWGGKVVEGATPYGHEMRDRNTVFIRELNDYIAASDELYGTLLPIRDGMFLIQKKEF